MGIKHISGAAGTIHVDDGGRGGLPVVFIHSFAGNASHWSAQLMHLRPSRRALALDLRAHGQSDAPADNDYAIESLADDLGAVVDALKIRKFVLVGHSIGGSVAIEYAGGHPDRVSGLVVVATPGKIPTEQAQEILSSLESDYDNVSEAYWEKLLSRAQPQVASQIRSEMGKLPRETAMALIRSSFEFDPLPPLRVYQGPKVAIITSHNESPYDLHRLLPDLPYRTLAGTGHWLHMDRPSDFNLMLDDFLGTIGVKKNGPTHTADEQVHNLLERLGHALSTADVKDASACWETPALMLTDDGANVLSEGEKIEQMFGKAVEWYRAQGLTMTRPEIERIERISERLTEVDVRWPAFDEMGNEKASERSMYIVHFAKDGQPRIQVALTRTVRLLAA